MTETDKKTPETPVMKDGKKFDEYSDELANNALAYLNKEEEDDDDKKDD